MMKSPRLSVAGLETRRYDRRSIGEVSRPSSVGRSGGRSRLRQGSGEAGRSAGGAKAAGPRSRRLRVAFIVVSCAAVVALAPLSAQAPTRTSNSAALSVLDYLEIEQLAYRYGYALDTGSDNGYGYADLYTADGTFTGTNQGPSGRSYTGREALAALARGGRRGPLWVSHYVTNVVIEPSSDGAVGRTYVAIFDIGNGGNGARSSVSNGGLYNDVYVRTPLGWRFKSRTFYASKTGAPVQPPPIPITTPRRLTSATSSAAGQTAAGRLSAEDHIAIQQLVARYAYALDQNGDNGASYADLFTDDAVFRQPRTEGRQNLAKLATAQPHGSRYTRHFITNHVIEAAPEGATGKQYLLVADIGESGQPGSIFLGGHYEDVYARTPAGWRFKTRTFIASATGDSR